MQPGVSLRLVFAAGIVLATIQSRALPEANAQTVATNHDKVVAAASLDQHWNGSRAMRDIATQLSFTPRSIGTVGHLKTINFIKTELAKRSHPAVESQEWISQDETGRTQHLTNVIAHFQPTNPRRMIVGTHYDSIVRAYRDPQNPSAPMPGANNSASGVAVLLETARALAVLPPAQ